MLLSIVSCVIVYSELCLSNHDGYSMKYDQPALQPMSILIVSHLRMHPEMCTCHTLLQSRHSSYTCIMYFLYQLRYCTTCIAHLLPNHSLFTLLVISYGKKPGRYFHIIITSASSHAGRCLTPKQKTKAKFTEANVGGRAIYQGPPGPTGGGVSYVRWGRTVCPGIIMLKKSYSFF